MSKSGEELRKQFEEMQRQRTRELLGEQAPPSATPPPRDPPPPGKAPPDPPPPVTFTGSNVKTDEGDVRTLGVQTRDGSKLEVERNEPKDTTTTTLRVKPTADATATGVLKTQKGGDAGSVRFENDEFSAGVSRDNATKTTTVSGAAKGKTQDVDATVAVKPQGVDTTASVTLDKAGERQVKVSGAANGSTDSGSFSIRQQADTHNFAEVGVSGKSGSGIGGNVLVNGQIGKTTTVSARGQFDPNTSFGVGGGVTKDGRSTDLSADYDFKKTNEGTSQTFKSEYRKTVTGDWGDASVAVGASVTRGSMSGTAVKVTATATLPQQVPGKDIGPQPEMSPEQKRAFDEALRRLPDADHRLYGSAYGAVARAIAADPKGMAAWDGKERELALIVAVEAKKQGVRFVDGIETAQSNGQLTFRFKDDQGKLLPAVEAREFQGPPIGNLNLLDKVKFGASAPAPDTQDRPLDQTTSPSGPTR